MAELGGGPVLDENFDFAIDQSGDISTHSGLPELEKDLAVLVAGIVEEMSIGRTSPSAELEDVRIDIGNQITQDDRIEDVSRITIEQDDMHRYQLNISIETTTNDGPFDMVIPVSP